MWGLLEVASHLYKLRKEEIKIMQYIQGVEISLYYCSEFTLHLLYSFPELSDTVDGGVRLERGRYLLHGLGANGYRGDQIQDVQ